MSESLNSLFSDKGLEAARNRTVPDRAATLPNSRTMTLRKEHIGDQCHEAQGGSCHFAALQARAGWPKRNRWRSAPAGERQPCQAAAMTDCGKKSSGIAAVVAGLKLEVTV